METFPARRYTSHCKHCTVGPVSAIEKEMGLFSAITSVVLSPAFLQSVFVGLLVFVAAVYYYFTREYGVYEAKGLPSIKPKLFFGNQKDMFTQARSMNDIHRDAYDYFKGHK